MLRVTWGARGCVAEASPKALLPGMRGLFSTCQGEEEVRSKLHDDIQGWWASSGKRKALGMLALHPMAPDRPDALHKSHISSPANCTLGFTGVRGASQISYGHLGRRFDAPFFTQNSFLVAELPQKCEVVKSGQSKVAKKRVPKL
eukprot:479599-Prorocentrum_minimum.AAC.3